MSSSSAYGAINLRALIALLLCAVALSGGVRPLGVASKGAGPYASGGGGSYPDPPAGALLGVSNPTPTLITVSSRTQLGPWFVQARLPGGGVLDAGVTDPAGQVVLTLIDGVHGFMLDVIDTDAVDVPVAAGVDVEVFLQ
jgi:hypothetical protein